MSKGLLLLREFWQEIVSKLRYIVSVIQCQVDFFLSDLDITLYYLCLQDGYEEILSDEEVSFQVE